ncbi:MAG TPA: MaoC/PaaZ C-terminal domain-containing protein [Pseudonocardia sp.]|nr:MaoC/PaaZ C-terminal domain-containing protein [Pseudonocardia sp.]
MALGGLYLKAALSSVGPRARELPDTVLTRERLEVDRAHLAEYNRVCGFGLTDALPVTYPHLLGFGLQVELMASRSFPLPLPGLVHINNTIAVHRRIEVGEKLDVRVHAERFVSHPKGAQVDLVAGIRAGDQEVWTGRSTYLARGAKAPDGGVTDAPDRPESGSAPVDLDAPPTAVWKVDSGLGRRYASVSGDVNPIHLHPLTAKAFGFPRAIAHGMWTAAHALAAVEGRLPDGLTYDVSFGPPVLLPSTVELRTRDRDGTWYLDVRSRNRPHLTGSVTPLVG